MNNAELTKEVETLKEQVAELQAMLSIVGMPYELKEIIRNEVIKQEDSTQAVTRTELISATPTSITIPVNPTGTLVLKWRGKEYKIFYV
jgi:hypothetical protein